jgi:MSHA biogenesis protein MshJ
MMLRERVTKLLRNIDALSLRERLFVFAAMLVVIGGAWEAFLAVPLEARELVATNKIQSTRERLATLDESVTVAAAGIGDGMSGQLERLRGLRTQVAEGRDSLRVFTSDLVDPATMRFVLEDLIRRQTGLQLVSVSNLPGRPVVEETGVPDAAPATDGPRLYRHGLVLVVEGSYLDCLRYLESVERLPWQLYWTRLELQTEEHPRNRITIELNTLSLEQDWIGV